jgi:hypothetical protein
MQTQTFDSVSQGARSISFEPSAKDQHFMHQTAKLQYHYYHPSESDFCLSSLSGTNRPVHYHVLINDKTL